MDYFTFGDFDSRNYAMYLRNSGEGRNRILSPPKVSITDRPLGSSGEILFDQYYASKTIPLDIFIMGEIETSVARQVGTYLGQLGQQKLTLSYEDYKYYLASFEDQLNGTEYSTGMMLDQLSFKSLSPFGYSRFTTSELTSGTITYDSGLKYDSGLLYADEMTAYFLTNMTNNQQFTIYHGGNTNFAYPTFKFTGGASSLTITQYTDSTYTTIVDSFSYGAFSGALDIDCSLRSVFKNSTMDNIAFSGEYISLNGITTPKFLNSGISIGVPSSTITLSQTASSVNGYYNGNIIYILNSNGYIMDKRTIVNYIGSTRVATLDTPFTGSESSVSYAIHKPTDGMNYFKITGSGFSNLNLTVDFRFVYL